ncbi:MAG: hypothetical protein Q8R34_01395 [bacterium]|nr:hypothetical protein [bacterium]
MDQNQDPIQNQTNEIPQNIEQSGQAPIQSVPPPEHKPYTKFIILAAILVVAGIVGLFLWQFLQKGQNINSNINQPDNTIMTQPTLQKNQVIWENGQTHILIDYTKESYTVYVSYPLGTKEKEVRELADENAAKGAKFVVIPQNQFVAGSEQYIMAKIIKNEYPEVDVAKGILKFLETYPGTPIGATWNGGIAFTYNDYVYTEKAYDQYIKSPAEYENSRPTDRRGDPIHPLNHFEPLLGGQFF